MKLLGTYPSESAAGADAAYLRSQGVEAEVHASRDIPGTDRGARLMVDLEYLATGTLPSQANATAEPDRPRWPKVIVIRVLLLAALLAVLQIAGTVGIGDR